ncbi:cold-shock protein [Nocardia camponoti]|uniref:DNA-binding protein n=1 Tax=Nocardia camponoti TaxID=1616106 RepID=A0A917Q808_9NOCA|nr:cold shock domain-containing protein [Nocardia camponoti]GGK34853.1 DNA-binding protein [Nocardia camponoti]
MNTGKLVSFDGSRGFGFIRPDDGGPDVFVHVNDIGLDEDQLRQGRLFEFDVTEGDRGPKAINLTAAGGAPAPRARKERATPSHGADDVRQQITELLLAASPALTAGEIITIRDRFTTYIEENGWLD